MTDHAEGHEHGLPPKSSVKRWLVTTNHKDIGVLYTITAVFFLVAGGILAMLIRSQLWTPGGTILGGHSWDRMSIARMPPATRKKMAVTV